MSKWELFNKLREFNSQNGYKNKGTPTDLKGVIVFSNESFDKPYPLEARSYVISSDNKAFFPDMISNSIFGSSLDGSDVGIRIDWYSDWIVEDCYLLQEG